MEMAVTVDSNCSEERNIAIMKKEQSNKQMSEVMCTSVGKETTVSEKNRRE